MKSEKSCGWFYHSDDLAGVYVALWTNLSPDAIPDRGGFVDWNSLEGQRILREVVELRETYDDITWQEMANTYGVTAQALRRAYQRHGKAVNKGRITYEDMRVRDDGDVTEFIEAMIDLQDAQDRLDTKQTRATIRLDETKPIGLAFTGDWHLGGKGIDYDLFREDADLLEKTDGLYAVGMGDYKENYLAGGHRGAQYEQIIQPGMQDEVVRYYMQKLRETFLLLVRGCHDDWSKKEGDQDFVATMAAEAEAVNLWHGGNLCIKLQGQTYTGHLRHKYKYESSLNTTNAMRRMFEIRGEADFAAIAHLHNPEVNMRHLMGKDRVMLRSGSYKKWDEHGQKVAGYQGAPGVPVLVLSPDKHEMIPFRDLRPAIHYLNAVRSA